MAVIDVKGRAQIISEALKKNTTNPPPYSGPSGAPNLYSPSTQVMLEQNPLEKPSGSRSRSSDPPDISPSRGATPSDFKPLLLTLFSHPPDQPTPVPTIRKCIQLISSLDSANAASPVQIGSFLTCLKMKGWGEEPAVIATVVEVMRSRTYRVKWSDAKEGEERCDIVGTGGDGKDTFNVSTTAGIVAAGAGLKVVKHGNRASSSSSGSADILIAADVPLNQLPSEALPTLADQLPFSFIFAPKFHPALARLAPLRRDLGFPTVLNLLGPLVNPIGPTRMVVGVPRASLGRVYAEAIKLLGVKRAWVVCGREGLDEISPEGETDVWDLKEDGNIFKRIVSPASFGLQSHPLSSVAGSTPEANASVLADLLSPSTATSNEATTSTPASVLKPIEDFVLLNTAALLVVGGKTEDLKEAVEMARESLRSGKAEKALRAFGEAAREAVRIAEAQ